MDLERALVPMRDDALPMQMGVEAPGLPGMPATEEEERALGVRRPVYIPAAEGTRKRKLGTWRVMSGVLSIMLFCVVGCGLLGVYGRDRVLAWLPHPQGVSPTQAITAFPHVAQTPVATPGPEGKYAFNVATYVGVDANHNCIGTPTSHFSVNDVVCVSATFRGLPKDQTHQASVHWFIQGTDIELPLPPVSFTGDKTVVFAIRFAQPGEGSAMIYIDRPANDSGNSISDPYLASVIYFAVQEPTPVPSPTAKPSGSPSTAPTATPHA